MPTQILLAVALLAAPPQRYDLGLAETQAVANGLKLVTLPADSPLRRVVRLPDRKSGRLEEGDVITKADGKPVKTLADLDARVQAGGGKPVTLTVINVRTGQPFDCEATPTAVAGPPVIVDPPPPPPLPGVGGGPKLHAVLVADTLDPDIGKGCRADLDTLLGLIKSHIHPSRVGAVTVLDGVGAAADRALAAVAALPARPQDTVLVYATCHGAFDPQVADPLSGGHFLALRKRGGRDLPRADLRRALADRPGRTKLLLTDACNTRLKIVRAAPPPTAMPVVPDAPPVAARPKVVSAVEKLLFAHAGRLDATAASPGEEAVCTDADGGLFTLALAAAMTRPGGWPQVLAQATSDARRGLKGRPQTAKVFENTLRPADPPGGLAPLLDPPGERGLPAWWGK
jgi:hypothetical protein